MKRENTSRTSHQTSPAKPHHGSARGHMQACTAGSARQGPVLVDAQQGCPRGCAAGLVAPSLDERQASARLHVELDLCSCM
eukprot:361334-Chlamydomonas_euryale.AAC.1